MILSDALRAISLRARRPVILGLVGGMCLVNIGMVALSLFIQRRVPPTATMPPAMMNPRMILATVLGCVFMFMISPISWQWTGDAKRMARPLRGVFQALGLHASFLVLSLLINWPNIKATLAMAGKIPIAKINSFYSLLGVGFLMGFGFNVMMSFALAFWEAKTAEKKEALQQAEEARWNLLRAQMSPHVLLNSLNGLAELVRDDTAAAVKGMRDLAEIYRQLLSMGETPTIPLGAERRFLERYLDVEKLRLGDSLVIEWDWNPELDDLQAMPLLIQPLVENAIKHGVAADPNGGIIRVSGHQDGSNLVLTVSNTGQSPKASPPKGTGVGLRNLKSRLELAYGTKASFALVREWPWTRATLTLPLEEKP